MLKKMDRYVELSAKEMLEAGRTSRISDITCRPLLAFAKSYLLRLGFLDGIEGFEIAAASGIYVFSKYVRLRELARERGGSSR